jgi:hypothetical protein
MKARLTTGKRRGAGKLLEELPRGREHLCKSFLASAPFLDKQYFDRISLILRDE